jgi:hypothetical protein
LRYNNCLSKSSDNKTKVIGQILLSCTPCALEKYEVVKEYTEIDEFGNEQLIYKIAIEEGEKSIPDNRTLKQITITNLDSNGEIS